MSPNPERSDETVDLTELKEYACGFRSLAGVRMGACKWSRALATTEGMPTRGPPGMSVRFPVSQEIPARAPSLFPNLSALVWLMRTRGFQKRRRDVNHERILVPGVQALSQQGLTSFNHYESAWRTENTGSNPVLIRLE